MNRWKRFDWVDINRGSERNASSSRGLFQSDPLKAGGPFECCCRFYQGR